MKNKETFIAHTQVMVDKAYHMGFATGMHTLITTPISEIHDYLLNPESMKQHPDFDSPGIQAQEKVQESVGHNKEEKDATTK